MIFIDGILGPLQMKSLIVLMDLYEHCEEVTRNATLPSGQLSSLFLPNLAGFESADLLRNNIWRENSNISATLPFLHRRHLILGSFANKQKSQILLGEKFPLDKMVTNFWCQLCVATNIYSMSFWQIHILNDRNTIMLNYVH